jgi:hypothetical protein
MFEGVAMNTLHHPDHCGPGYRYPTRVRDLAFQLWAFRCSRRLTCVADELASVGLSEGWACVPGERTLRHWATKGDWPAAAASALRSIAPELTEGLVADMITGAAEGMPYFRDVLAGRVPHPDSTRIRAILTALSMIGVPDLAHATVRDATCEREAGQPLPFLTISQAEAPPSSVTSWKEQLATRLGLTSQTVPADDDGVPSPGQGQDANGREGCTA